MILCATGDFRRYLPLNTRFTALAQALDTQALRSRAPGRHDILGDELYLIATPEAATRPSAMLEAHRRYIDIHVVLNGTERMGWSPLSTLVAEDQPFDVDRDFICFREPPSSVFSVLPEWLVVFFPEDAHVPLLGDGQCVHKCVFKVLVDGL